MVTGWFIATTGLLNMFPGFFEVLIFNLLHCPLLAGFFLSAKQ
jgi:hypothetical protein